MNELDFDVFLKKWLKEHNLIEDWFRNLDGKLLYVTQMSAICAAMAAGHGDKNLVDGVATMSMRTIFGSIKGIETHVKIGEGERDNAPMLYLGEIIGKGRNKIDIAVDPLENTNATANLGENAICVIAATPRDGLMSSHDGYMNKLVVGPDVGNKVNINFSVKENVEIIAESLKRSPAELTITVLDRPRNKSIIDEIRATGARARVIPDGDLVPGILTCISGVSNHALMGIGASPEGVITAAAVKCLGGYMQAKFWSQNDQDSSRYFKAGIDLTKAYDQDELAPGDSATVCITAVTALSSATKHILDGVSFFPGGAKTDSYLFTNRSFERITVTHVLDRETFKKKGSKFMT